MATTVLSGTSGALYYKPAGTTGTFGEAGVNVSTDVITVSPYLNFKVGDPACTNQRSHYLLRPELHR